jgi:hypothetical protein
MKPANPTIHQLSARARHKHEHTRLSRKTCRSGSSISQIAVRAGAALCTLYDAVSGCGTFWMVTNQRRISDGDEPTILWLKRASVCLAFQSILRNKTYYSLQSIRPAQSAVFYKWGRAGTPEDPDNLNHYGQIKQHYEYKIYKNLVNYPHSPHRPRARGLSRTPRDLTRSDGHPCSGWAWAGSPPTFQLTA